MSKRDKKSCARHSSASHSSTCLVLGNLIQDPGAPQKPARAQPLFAGSRVVEFFDIQKILDGEIKPVEHLLVAWLDVVAAHGQNDIVQYFS